MAENKALAISIGLHLAIFASLIFSVSFSKTTMVFATPAPSQPINAVFIDAQAIADERRQQQAQAQARQRELERQERARKQKIAQEKKAKDDAERKRKEQERRKQQALQEQERKNLEQAAREEAEFQRRLKEESERQKAFEKELAEQLAQEQAAMAAAQQQRVMSELEKYQALIMQTIFQNLIIDESAKNKICIIRLKLAPDGLVIDTSIVDGDVALCQAARSAVLRPSRLPISKDPLVYEQMKDIKLTVNPTTIR